MSFLDSLSGYKKKYKPVGVHNYYIPSEFILPYGNLARTASRATRLEQKLGRRNYPGEYGARDATLRNFQETLNYRDKALQPLQEGTTQSFLDYLNLEGKPSDAQLYSMTTAGLADAMNTGQSTAGGTSGRAAITNRLIRDTSAIERQRLQDAATYGMQKQAQDEGSRSRIGSQVFGAPLPNPMSQSFLDYMGQMASSQAGQQNARNQWNQQRDAANAQAVAQIVGTVIGAMAV